MNKIIGTFNLYFNNGWVNILNFIIIGIFIAYFDIYIISIVNYIGRLSLNVNHLYRDFL